MLYLFSYSHNSYSKATVLEGFSDSEKFIYAAFSMMSFLLLLKTTPYFAQERAMKPNGSKRGNSLYRNKTTKVNAAKLM